MGIEDFTSPLMQELGWLIVLHQSIKRRDLLTREIKRKLTFKVDITLSATKQAID